MNESLQYLIEYGYIILFIGVLVDQIGIPLPVLPLLLAAGALSKTGQLDLLAIILLAASGSFLSNIFWYEMGRYRGSAILGFICKISFEPATCIRRTEDTFLRHGKGSLLLAKFVPGLNAVAAPIAGVFKMPRLTFLLLNGISAILWAACFIGLGYLFQNQLEDLLEIVLNLSGSLATIVVAIFIIYIGYKYLRRHLMIRSLRVARITPEELKQKIDEKIDLFIIDLRNTLNNQSTSETLLNALQIAPHELSNRYHEIPTDREIILFCT